MVAAGLFALLLFATLLASPLAFLLLVLVLAGGALERPPRGATVAVIATAVALELALRGSSRARPLPVRLTDLVPGCSSACSGSRSRRVAGARRSSGSLGLPRGLLVAFVVPSDLGSNVERLRFAAIPLALLAATLAPRRILPRGAARRRAGFWNVSALAHRLRTAARTRVTTASTGARDPLPARPPQPDLPRRGRRHRGSLARRVPPGRTAFRSCAAGIARTTSRRTSCSTTRSSRPAYREWLRRLGVRYVVISDAPPDYSSRARGEADPLRPLRPPSGLPRLHVTVYAVPRRKPLVTGPGDASVRGCGRRASSSRSPARPVPRRAALVAVLDTTQGCVSRGPTGWCG